MNLIKLNDPGDDPQAHLALTYLFHLSILEPAFPIAGNQIVESAAVDASPERFTMAMDLYRITHDETELPLTYDQFTWLIQHLEVEQ